MASREIRDLSAKTQIFHNKLADRFRRDTDLRARNIAPVLTCTYRTPEEQVKVQAWGGGPRTSQISAVGNDGKPASEEFEMMVLVSGQPINGLPVEAALEMMYVVEKHAEVVGLEAKPRGFGVFAFKEKR